MPFHTRNLPQTKGRTGDNGLTRQKDARSIVCDCQWTVRFKKQLNDTWIVTQLVDQHERHQLEGINPSAYPENRRLTPPARETMLDLVGHFSAPYNTIASVLNATHGVSLLGRDVYNRLYDYSQDTVPSTAKLIEILREDGFIYRVKVAMDNTLEALFLCKPHDVLMALNIIIVDHNLRTLRIALSFISNEQTSAYT
ncbi:hypothetical protein V1517DRAFT_52672 [Lipomyces orientalis]|uniref:Uncharacterized protein n=1 Tax=Lipomyces orientalis TaxID=1233043 RepID=A0ACC3TF44_9ASCO